MNEDLILGLIAYVIIFTCLSVYYLIRGGWIKKPVKKNQTAVAKLEQKQKEEKIKVERKKNNEPKLKHITEVQFLINNFNLDWRFLYFKRYLILYAFIDSTIIVGTFELIMILKWKMIVALIFSFFLLMGLIFSIYSLLGKYFVRKGYIKK